MTALFSGRIVRVVRMIQVLDELPEGIVQRPGRIWNVLARSLGEQGAGGRTALAWRWALTGACPSPVTLRPCASRPPRRDELLAEAGAPAELTGGDADPGGQVMHARFVLQWLAGELDGLPLWNGGPQNPHVTDGADYARTGAEIEEVYGWALAARLRYPWPASPPWTAHGWASAGGTARCSFWPGRAGKQGKGRCRACACPGGRRRTRSHSTSAGR